MRAIVFTTLCFIIAVATARSQTPAAIETELLGYAENIAKYGTYCGAYDGDKLSRNSDLLRQKLLTYGKRADVLKYSFPKIKGGELYVATSKDGRFRIYSWDLNTGGTMHDFDQVFQY